MATFKPEEIAALQAGGNQVWLGGGWGVVHAMEREGRYQPLAHRTQVC